MEENKSENNDYLEKNQINESTVEETPNLESNSEISEPIKVESTPPESKVQKSTPTGMIVALVVAVAIASFFAGTYFSNMNSDVVTTSDLQQAISSLESKIVSNQPTTQQAPQPVKISIDDDPIRGDPNAPITIIEFSDFQCPFCARFHEETLPSLLADYIEEGKVNLVYRDFPIQSLHPNALPAAVAAECANEQGKYWEYHDTLFENQNSWNRLDSNSAISTFSQFAADVGLEEQQFDSCLGSGKYLEEVRADLQDGKDYGITGTPGFFIGNEEMGFVKISGAQPFESFKRVIDAQLES